MYADGVGWRRMNITKAAWLSLCRAMRTASQDKGVFHLIAIDDSGAPIQSSWLSEWRERCAAPNLQTVEHVMGLRSISDNMRTGFRWAAAREACHATPSPKAPPCHPPCHPPGLPPCLRVLGNCILGKRSFGRCLC
jgi:hypothetical protein